MNKRTVIISLYEIEFKLRIYDCLPEVDLDKSQAHILQGTYNNFMQYFTSITSNTIRPKQIYGL